MLSGDLFPPGVLAFTQLVDLLDVPPAPILLPSADVRCACAVQFAGVLEHSDVVQARLVGQLLAVELAVQKQLDQVRLGDRVDLDDALGFVVGGGSCEQPMLFTVCVFNVLARKFPILRLQFSANKPAPHLDSAIAFAANSGER